MWCFFVHALGRVLLASPVIMLTHFTRRGETGQVKERVMESYVQLEVESHPFHTVWERPLTIVVVDVGTQGDEETGEMDACVEAACEAVVTGAGGILQLFVQSGPPFSCPLSHSSPDCLILSPQYPPRQPLLSPGQVSEEPSQLSPGSQALVETRQIAVDLVSLGQVAEVPVQFSAVSHVPADARHSVDEDWKALAGQLALLPGHVSATSQVPADARQVVPDWNESEGHVALAAGHVSAVSQTPADARHV